MSGSLTIALAQLNPTVGDIGGNAERLRHAHAEAMRQGADLVVATELAISGYPSDDLVLKPSFPRRCEEAVRSLAPPTADGPALLVGTPWPGETEGRVYNAAVLLVGGEVAAVRFKHDLPNYGVFDEKRVFTAGPVPGPVPFRTAAGVEVRLGVMVCEDMWTPDVAECLAETGAEILVIPNASPFEVDKADRRLNLAVARVKETGLPLVYVNQIGGQDELVFDGGSFVLDADCRMRASAAVFREELLLTRWARDGEAWVCEEGRHAAPFGEEEVIYQALMLGLRDYVDKNRFPSVVLGLSGGIDSAFSAAVAVDSLGADRVRCVMMPSRYTSNASISDAREAAERLGVRLDTVPIEPAIEAFDGMLAELFAGREADTTEENLQSRIRGVILMAISNKFGPMVLTTGNKSEMSVGYATLYGDMCGGYNVLKDVYKTTVFALSRWRNAQRPAGALGPDGVVVPPQIIDKPPSAELRADQRDEDSLPPYPALDDMLNCLIEREMDLAEVVERGHAPEVVERVFRLVNLAEYKRRQAPPGVKITSRAFGRDRRYPITNHFRGSATD
jgi:NAD+ synthase